MHEEEAELGHAGGARYFACYVALTLLTALTYWLSTIEMGDWSLAVALLIACSKAAVVVLFFMHLWDHKGANRLVFVVSLLFIATIIGMTLVDISTRFPLALPHAQ